MQNSRHQREIVLASRSPRRRYLLEQAGLTFRVVPSTLDESRFPLTDPVTYATTLAEAKADAVAGLHPDRWVIGADTIVRIGDAILGKPGSPEEARAMLRRLSGQTHEVVTGYCICCRRLGKKIVESAVTGVRFKTLSAREIAWYIHTGEPFDKAGAYAIQGLGTFLVKTVDGSYTNVVGLPVCEVIEYLIREEVIRFGGRGAPPED